MNTQCPICGKETRALIDAKTGGITAQYCVIHGWFDNEH